MKLLRKFGALLAPALAIFFTTQFLAAQTGPTVFTPQLTVSPGFLRVVTGPTTVQDLTILGTCSGCGTGTVVANPTGTIGLTPVNGVLASALRSDGAPALSQAIVPTWSGIHTFSAIPLFNGGTSGVSAPFSVDSNTLVTNLNADLLDGLSSAAFALAAVAPANPSATIGLTAVNGSAVTYTRSDGAPALSQSIVPTWTGIHTFSAIPAFNGGTSGVSAPFSVDSNSLITNLNADLLDDLNSTVFAQLANSQTFTGTNLFQGTAPRIRFNSTGAGADEKQWHVQSGSTGAFVVSTRTDADGTGTNAIQISRTGTTPNAFAITSTSLTWNGSPISTATGANPSASLGLTAVNGSAATFMRSDGAPALSQAIIPTWSGAHTWTANMQQSKADPRFCQYDSGSDATWFWRMSTDVLRLQVVDGTTCTTTGSAIPFTASVAGGVTSSIALVSTALTWNGSPISTAVGANPSASLGLTAVNGSATTFMRSDGAPALDQTIAPTWTGAHIFSNAASIKATGATAAELENALPLFEFDETDAAANERNYLFSSNAGQLRISTATDAAPTTPVNNALVIDRTGTTVDSIAAAATAFTFNGDPITTETSGSFQTLETTGCSNTHSLLYQYRKIGTVVTLHIRASGDCTSDGAGFVQYASTNWPAAILPQVVLRMSTPWSTCGAVVLQNVFQINASGVPLMDFRPTCALASTLQFNGNLSMVVTYSTAFTNSPG